MSRKGGKGFNLPEVGRGKGREGSVRQTARAFFSEETAAATPPREESSRGQAVSHSSARGAGRADSALRVVTPPREDSSPRQRRRAGEAKAHSSTRTAAGESKKGQTWRAPREDGRLRSNDRVALNYLRTRLTADGETTEEVGMKEIAAALDASHRTAQNTVLRLQEAGLLTRIAQEVGSNKGCRYRISKGAPMSSFVAAH